MKTEQQLRDNIYQFEVKPSLPGDKPFWEDFSDEYGDLDFEEYQEAAVIFVQVAEIILDKTIQDKTVREAIFSKVPEEKLKWASGVFKEYLRSLQRIRN